MNLPAPFSLCSPPGAQPMRRIAPASVLLFVAGIMSDGAGARAAELMVVGVEPAARSVAAPVTSPIVVHFDRPVQPASVLGGDNLWAFGRWSGPATGAFAFSNGNQTVTLTPVQPFSAGESVMVMLSHDLQAADGSTLRAAGYSYQFWTRTLSTPMQFAVIDQFSTRTTPSQSSRAYGGFASDLNHDGFLDISIVNENTADVRVFLNRADHSGLFQPFLQPTFPVGRRASPSEPTDFNHDGHVDVCVANIDDATVSVLLGAGNGTFAPQQLSPVGADPRGIAVLDVDGDGDMDIVNTNWASSNMSLILNNGNGVFGAAASFEGGASGEWALAAADMNEDGILDLVIGAQNSRQIVVRTGNGDGTFSLASTQNSGGFVWMLNVADVNGDGHEDVAVANSSSNNGAILMGDGTGQLAAPQTYSTDPFPLATDLADLDGDGDLDWITSSFNGDWRLRSNNGDGTFTLVQDFTAPAAASCSIALDFDNDGDVDLALIDELDDVVILMRNSGYTAPPVPTVSQWGTTCMALMLLVAGTSILRWQTRRPLRTSVPAR